MLDEERKKEEEEGRIKRITITKLKFSCLLPSTTVWGSKTPGKFLQ